MSNIKDLAKHSANYLLAMLATKALAFVSIPVYTYLLSVEEYGIYNVFLSTTGIATVLLTLNTEVAISRYYFDAKDENDFKRFVGTSIRLSFFVFALMSLALIIFCKPLSNYLDFEIFLTISIIPVSLYAVVNSVFQQIYQSMLQSKKIAIVSSVQAYLAFGLSTLCILLLDDKKYYGLVYGTIAAMLILAVYSINQIKGYYIGCWDRKHVKYILTYSLPYLPYSLSGVLLAQFGKIIIGQENGFESAGLYSFASSIALLLSIIISVTHSAWNPYYFRYMNNKDYNAIDTDYTIIWKVTLLFASFLCLFGKEIGAILGRQEYLECIYLVPILVVGYCFYQWAYVYLRNTGYAKQTIWNAIVVGCSGVSNMILNTLLIKKYGEIGVSISFTISYFMMMLLAFFINKFCLKLYTPKFWMFLKPLLLMMPFLMYPYYVELMFKEGDTILFKIVLYLIIIIIVFRYPIFTYCKFKKNS